MDRNPNPLPSPKEIALNEVAGLPPELQVHKEAIAAIVEKAVRMRDWQIRDLIQMELGYVNIAAVRLREKFEAWLRS